MPNSYSRLRRRLSAGIGALLVAMFALPAAAEDANWAPSIEIGSALPAFSAQDQNGQVRAFDDLKGEKGLVLVFSRSFDW